MKRYIIIGLVSVLLTAAFCAIDLRAGTIKATGINQGDLYKFLSATVTLVNSLKTNFNLLNTNDSTNTTNYNSTFATYSANNVILKDNITKYNTAFAIYSANNVILAANVTKYNSMYASYSSFLALSKGGKGAGYNSYSAILTAIPVMGGSQRNTTVTSSFGGTQRNTTISNSGGNKRMTSGGASTVSSTSLSLTQ